MTPAGRAAALFAICLAGVHAGPAVSASSDCRTARTSEAVARCLGDDLRESDRQINASYKALMKASPEAERRGLRREQRAWIKERDAVCGLNNRETDRERWYEKILADYRTTVCVTRYTSARTVELDRMLAGKRATADREPPPQTPRALPAQKDAYEIVSTQRDRGRWYFEVTVKAREISQLSPTAIWIGCRGTASRKSYGALLHIRPGGGTSGASRIGIALDLEDGKMYISRDGAWRSGGPGSAKGFDLKLGQAYRCGVESTVVVASLVGNGLLAANFGDTAFTYTVPAGYRPFSGN